MEDLFEDRGGHCLVAGEDSGPFLDELVGGEGDAAAALAIADPAEEEGGAGSFHHFGTHLVHDKGRDAGGLLAAQLRGRGGRRPCALREGVLEAVEGSFAALLPRLDPEGDGEVALTLSGSPCGRRLMDSPIQAPVARVSVLNRSTRAWKPKSSLPSAILAGR